MHGLSPEATLVMLGLSLLAAMVTALAIGRLGRPRRRSATRDDASVFLFDGEVLVDATPAARRLLDRIGGGEDSDFAALTALLSHRFPDLLPRLHRLGGSGEVRIEGLGRSGALEVAYREGLVRLTLVPPEDAGSGVDVVAFEALQDELRVLRGIAEDAPQLIWKQEADGRVTWANAAYLALADSLAPRSAGDGAWPRDCVFPELRGSAEAAPPVAATPGRRRSDKPLRLEIGARRKAPRIYEVTRFDRGGEVIHFGTDVTALAEAEQARHVFVQTLTQTFAQLSIGLAIFDRRRRLVMFNPAFHDLTGLPVAFLGSQPQVQTVLDRLRDMNMLPEPRNYASWRDQIVALEEAAASGSYRETWSLPGGRTLRVSGRPHPEGALAFLFEDISAEIALTRHFRAELETAQAVIDTLSEAVAVFSPNGQRVSCNAAYAARWGQDRGAARDVTLAQEIALWKSHAAPTNVWTDLRDFVGAFGDRAPWAEVLRLRDGRALRCELRPLPGGETMVLFTDEVAGDWDGRTLRDESAGGARGRAGGAGKH
ncbi:PAS domain-containing protein [Pseudoroseicyclus aestuarii]|uniref:PAS domain-containing protein n=2 Tax=Pseudoroseicyclus aestuarii TaxID=1795041 RepID=A0A318STD9_9RHOB|nr:PAS domain-containing protein [Pseudoroseicyclus aestuarii]